MAGAVVLLSGASAVGKTSAALSLQERLAVPSVYFPKEAVRVRADLDPWREKLIELERSLLDAYLVSLIAYARAGFVAIGETILWPSDVAAVRTALAKLQALAVRLTCDTTTLVERERTRATTFSGFAAESAAQEASTGFDLTIDTVANDADAVADLIAAHLVPA